MPTKSRLIYILDEPHKRELQFISRVALNILLPEPEQLCIFILTPRAQSQRMYVVILQGRTWHWNGGRGLTRD